jgi:hypothetical protein
MTLMLVLTSNKDRKQIFESYCKEHAVEAKKVMTMKVR